MKNSGLRTISIVLKCVQIALVLIAMASVAHSLKEYRDSRQKHDSAAEEISYDLGTYGRLEFFVYSTAVGAVVAFCALVAIFGGIIEKNGGALAVVASHSLWALQLLVSAALLAKVHATLDDKHGGSISACDTIKQLDTDFNCDQILTGVIFGFLAAGAFAADAVLSFVSYIRPSEPNA